MNARLACCYCLDWHCRKEGVPGVKGGVGTRGLRLLRKSNACTACHAAEVKGLQMRLLC